MRTPDGFSLVEVVLALGIFSFGIVAIFGLMSAGLKGFQDSVDINSKSRIVERLTADVQSRRFANLGNLDETRYFDHEGREVEEAASPFYAVNIKTVPDAVILPGGHALGDARRFSIIIQRRAPSGTVIEGTKVVSFSYACNNG